MALVLGAALGGCAGAGTSRGAPGPPAASDYEPGTPPVETRFSQTATLYLSTGETRRALTQARQGIERYPENPIHHYLAGVAHARLGEYGEADRSFSEAERIYPAYELEIEPQREAAWARAFNAGLEAHREGDLDAAIEAWEHAALIFDLRPAAHRNLATVLTEEGRYEEAIQVYRSALDGLGKRPATGPVEDGGPEGREEIREEIEQNLSQLLLFTKRFAEAEPLLWRQLERDSASVRLRSDLAAALEGLGRGEEAGEIYASLLAEDELEAGQLFNLGIALFRSARYGAAGEAFRRLTELQPDSRDAWFNYVNSLFAGRAWEALVEGGDRLLELDPLNEDARLITARARLETGDREGAVRGLARADSAPVYVDGLRLRTGRDESVLEGRVVGNAREPGTPVRLRFTFYGDAGLLGVETVTLRAPPREESEEFEISVEGRAFAYRYELVPDARSDAADSSTGSGPPPP